jgi:hypothetical protein
MDMFLEHQGLDIFFYKTEIGHELKRRNSDQLSEISNRSNRTMIQSEKDSRVASTMPLSRWQQRTTCISAKPPGQANNYK